ncbi:MAG: benzoate-CoA ligase family protein [Alphaproteobacteria bacterium]
MNATDVLLDPWCRGAHAARPAIVWRDRIVTFGELAESVLRAAQVFAELGLEADGRVVFLMEDTPSLAASYLGAMKAGGVAVAVNPRLGPDELLAVLEDSRPSVVVADGDGAVSYERVRPRLAREARAVLRGEDLDCPTASHRDAGALPARTPRDMAFWVYTSGTTGRIKAAIHRHRDVLPSDLYLREVLGVGPDDRLFATSKLFFAYALGTILFGTLKIGATAILHDGRSDPELVAAILVRHEPSIVFSVPTLYRAMLASGVAATEPFRAVKHYVSAGERLPASLFERWRAETGGEILDGMGTSETIYMLLSNRPGRICPGASGTPAPGVEARLESGTGPADSPGTSGVLEVRTLACADGYWQRPEESARAFRGEWFSTGDLYRIDEGGYWHHQGRADDRFKVRGQWVSPSEVEEIVMAEDGILDAALVGIADPDGLTEGVLYLVPREERGPVDVTRLSEVLAGRLPPHKRPQRIEIVAAIPRTATGKIQRFKLRRGITGAAADTIASCARAT